MSGLAVQLRAALRAEGAWRLAEHALAVAALVAAARALFGGRG